MLTLRFHTILASMSRPWLNIDIRNELPTKSKSNLSCHSIIHSSVIQYLLSHKYSLKISNSLASELLQLFQIESDPLSDGYSHVFTEQYTPNTQSLCRQWNPKIVHFLGYANDQFSLLCHFTFVIRC